MKIIKSASLDTLDAISIDVESTFTKGMPTFTIVGMISTSIIIKGQSQIRTINKWF